MENKSLETRYLYISNYKNIGISYLDDDSNESENTQKLLLNANHSGQNMGGLTMVVGENNVGKSNVAKALSAFSYQKKLNSKEDLPNFIGHGDCAINLSLSYKTSKETQGGGGDDPAKFQIA